MRTKKTIALLLAILTLCSAFGFTSAAALLGDANGDGKITSVDARTILRHAARVELIEDETVLPLMDVDGNGKIASSDARLALRMAGRLDPTVEYKPGSESIDYLVLVNKQSKLPDDWEETVDLAEGTNSLGETYLVERKTLEQFNLLREDLLKDGIDIEMDSTYRSVKRQQEIWDEFEAERGLEYAQKYVAVPGYSEHHTGLVIDVKLIKDGVVIEDNDEMIAEKEIFAEVHKRLADFGFILRYMEGKEDITGYAYEPWHFRYVGYEPAKVIYAKGLTLEEYLEGRGAEIDYLTLVNKQNKLPEDWEKNVDLAVGTNSLGETYLVERKTLEQFNLLREDLLKDGIDIEMDSTYRSVKRQQEIWDEFEAERGLEYAQKYVAVPGYSEHHTGLVIDVKLIKDGVVIEDNDEMIAEKEIFAEVHKRLADFGFILRYMEGKEDITGYAYEPWHFRYVGVEAAKEIAEKGLTLEEYLGAAPGAISSPRLPKTITVYHLDYYFRY